MPADAKHLVRPTTTENAAVQTHRAPTRAGGRSLRCAAPESAASVDQSRTSSFQTLGHSPMTRRRSWYGLQASATWTSEIKAGETLLIHGGGGVTGGLLVALAAARGGFRRALSNDRH